VLADRFEGRRLNSPNDLVCRSDGTVYFTDPPFGLPGVYADPDRELGFSGVFRVSPDGAVHLVTDELEAQWDRALARRAVPVRRQLGPRAQGRHALRGRRRRRRLERNGAVRTTDAPGEDAIDGVKVDQAGSVYACGPGGIWVVSPEGGHLGTLRLPESPHNLAWGDEDGRTLYVTALTGVYRLRLTIAGVRPA
jgi:gluconolactonase